MKYLSLGSPRNSFTAKIENKSQFKRYQIKEKGKLICQGIRPRGTNPSGIARLLDYQRILIRLNCGRKYLVNWQEQILIGSYTQKKPAGIIN